MSLPPERSRLDDPAALERGDPAAMLRVVAGAGAQVREAAGAASEAQLGRMADDGRPRAVVVAGVGVSALCGDLLAAVAGPRCPVPIIGHRHAGLPRWVGAADAVCAVSATGTGEEILSAVGQAVARDCNLMGAGPEGSPLAELVARGRGRFAAVPAGRLPRASLWGLSVPLLLAGAALDLLWLDPADLPAAADRLDAIAQACRPSSESFVNPAKQLALDLSGTLPLVWGTSPLTGVAALRLAAQLAQNAKHPSLPGLLPEAGQGQVAVLDGTFGRDPADPAGGRDIFADRVDEPDRIALRLVLLRDPDESPRVQQQVAESVELAQDRGLAVTELRAEGAGPVERLAGLVGLTDFASVYLAVLGRVDPTPTLSLVRP